MAENETTQELTSFPVSLPGVGQTITHQISADMLVSFNFDVADAVFTGNGNDLIINVEGGGTIIFEDYRLLAQEESLPTFELMNGEQVAGDVYLFAFTETDGDSDEIETAAGATADRKSVV